MKVVVVTHFPSPYQVELFNAVAAAGGMDLEVVYLREDSAGRHWERCRPAHKCIALTQGPAAIREAGTAITGADLVVFNYYRDKWAIEALHRRAHSGRPWAFWGERPGFRHPFAGRWYRRWVLRDLHSNEAPVWGMGRFAVEEYRREFGVKREYRNLPYFSNLDRFTAARRARTPRTAGRVILYSGALIERKGIDLLAESFARLAGQFPGSRLRILGSGDELQRISHLLNPVVGQVDMLGFQDWEQLPAIYAEADLLCVPSRYDGWGLVVPEGLAAGLPVIATTSMGAALDLIECNENGWLIPAGDGAALEHTLRDALALPDSQLASMSEAAIASVAAHTLADGVRRFVDASRAAIDDWIRSSG